MKTTSRTKPPKRETLLARLAVVGSGPGGIAAAVTASEQLPAGERIVLIDEQPAPGGQIWRGSQKSDPVAQRWIERLNHESIEPVQGQVIGADSGHTLLLETAKGTMRVAAETIILATGARERFVPFPGWTLPGISGIGGLQAMMKSGWPVKGKRLVIAGSGPLMFPVAATAKKFGAKVLEIAEQAAWWRLAYFALHLAAYPEKLFEGLRFFAKLWSIPQSHGTWIKRAGGTEKLEWVELTDGARTRRIDCDLLAIGAHLVPNTELAALLGCRIDSAGRIAIDQELRTSEKKIFAVGECTGVGGADRALIQGQLAALAALNLHELFAHHVGALPRWERFSRLLDATFSPREELKRQIQGDTIVCRCEDIPHEGLCRHDSWREAKLQTRCGMGPCQGRVCGPAAQTIYGWGVESVRPPILPCKGSTLLELDKTEMNS